MQTCIERVEYGQRNTNLILALQAAMNGCVQTELVTKVHGYSLVVLVESE